MRAALHLFPVGSEAEAKSLAARLIVELDCLGAEVVTSFGRRFAEPYSEQYDVRAYFHVEPHEGHREVARRGGRLVELPAHLGPQAAMRGAA